MFVEAFTHFHTLEVISERPWQNLDRAYSSPTLAIFEDAIAFTLPSRNVTESLDVQIEALISFHCHCK